MRPTSRPTNVVYTLNQWYADNLSAPIHWWDGGLDEVLKPPSWTLEHEDMHSASVGAGNRIDSQPDHDLLAMQISGKTIIEAAVPATTNLGQKPMPSLMQMREELLELVRFTQAIPVKEFSTDGAGILPDASDREYIEIGMVKENQIAAGEYESQQLISQVFEVGYQYLHIHRQEK